MGGNGWTGCPRNQILSHVAQVSGPNCPMEFFESVMKLLSGECQKRGGGNGGCIHTLVVVVFFDPLKMTKASFQAWGSSKPPPWGSSNQKIVC